MKKYGVMILCGVPVIVFSVFVGMAACNPNFELEVNELRARFRDTVSLDYHPDVETISKVEIGGIISMSVYDDIKSNGTAIYTDKNKTERIIERINSIELVEASEKELPNMSADSFIQFYGVDGAVVKSYVIFGDVFIKDDDRLYRMKDASVGIAETLETTEFE